MFQILVARRVAVSLTLLAGLFLASNVRGQEAEVDPKAADVLKSFGKFYADLKGFKMDVKISLKVEQLGKKETQEFLQKFSVEKPNKISYALESPEGGATITSDGTDLTLLINSFNKYAVEEAPPTFTALFENPVILNLIGFGNAGEAILAMVSENPAASLISGSQSIEYGGTADLDGVKCHVLKAVQEQFDWEIWIDAGDQPLVRQFAPDLKKAIARMTKPGEDSPYADLKITNTISYTDWEVNPKFDAAAFALKAPKDSTQADSIMELVTGRSSQEAAPHVLLGKPAPQIELELLAGGQLNLGSLKGEKIVILDFWATWCGPCVQAMPIIEKVAEKFKDKGVELYAVNLQEGPDEIQAFLKEADLGKVAVALDKSGKTAAAYLAEAIPQTVIVGKDGSVQVVKIGLSPNLEADLTKDLEALIEGKDLASETLANFEKKAKERAERKAKQAAKQEAEKPSDEATPK